MKKYILIALAFCLGIEGAWSQTFTPCIDKNISTNPALPINTESGSGVRLNTFDWTVPKYRINSGYIASDSLDSPWYQDDNSNVLTFLLDKDRLPKDGWELIKYDIGVNTDGSLSSPPAGFIYVVLYNKYTGVLRVCVAGDRPQSYNGAQIALKLEPQLTAAFFPSILSHMSEVKPVDVFGEDDKEAVAVTRYLNGIGEWFYADFAMAYDPCVCNFESGFFATITLIDSAIVNLSGSITDAVANLKEKDQGGIFDPGWAFSPKNLASAGKTAQKSYKSANEFVLKQKKALKAEGKTNAQLAEEEKLKIGELNKFQELLKEDDFLQAGLKAFPYVSGALELVKFFVSGGKEGSGASPVSINADIRLKGSIFAPYDYKDIVISTPGSLNANNNLSTLYPFYNEALGVFNLLETPEVYYYRHEWTQCTSWTNIVRPCAHVHGHIDWLDVDFSLKDDQALKYVVNPSSELEIVELFAALEYSYPDTLLNSYGIETRNNISVHATKGLDVEDQIYRTQLIPLGCAEEANLSIRGFSSINLDNGEVFLKIFANLKRKDGLGQKVLWVGSYPVKLVEVISTDPAFNSIFSNGLPEVYSKLRIGTNGTVQNVTQTLRSVDSIFIQPGATFQPGVQLVAPYIEISPGVIIPPGVELRAEYPIVCSVPLPIATNSEISTFCTSSKYKSISRETSREPSIVKSSSEKSSSLTAHPNPFTHELTLEFTLPAAGVTSARLLDPLGREVMMLWNGREREAGPQSETIDLSALAAGIYLAVLETPQGRQTVRVVKE